MQLNQNQILAIIMAILGVMIGSTAQLTDLFGPAATKEIVTIASLANSLLSSILVVITGQTGAVKTVLAMPGVEKISVNDKANQSLAAMAIDPNVNKIAPTQAAMEQVTKTAEGVLK